MTRQRHEVVRRGRGSPPLAPSKAREQETTSAGTPGPRHKAGRSGRGSPPLATSQGREQETPIAVPAGSGPRISDGDNRVRGMHVCTWGGRVTLYLDV